MARCVATQTISRRRLWGVWTGEHDGVAIRSPIGKLLGLLKGYDILTPPENYSDTPLGAKPN